MKEREWTEREKRERERGGGRERERKRGGREIKDGRHILETETTDRESD